MTSQRRPALNVALHTCLAFALLSFIALGPVSAQEQQQPKTEAPKTTTPAPPPQLQQTPSPELFVVAGAAEFPPTGQAVVVLLGKAARPGQPIG